MWEWQHDTLGTDALGRFFDAIGFFFFFGEGVPVEPN